MVLIKCKLTVIIMLILVLVGCSTVKTARINDNEWKQKTLDLVNMGHRDGEVYVDFSDTYFSTADIYETTYLLEISKMYNLKIENRNTEKFIRSEIEKTSDIWGLINVFKAAKVVNANTESISDKIQKELDMLDLSIDSMVSTTEEKYEDGLFLYKELSKIETINIEPTLRNYIGSNIEQRFKAIRIDRIHVSNPILYLNNYNYQVSVEFLEIIRKKIISILNEKGDLWEMYQLLEIFCEYSKDSNVNKALAVLLGNTDNLSNMQLYYLLKANFLVGNDIEPYRETVIKRLKNCETVSGGYSAYRIYSEIPSVFSYFSIYIMNYFGEEVTDETFKELYTKITNNLKSNTLNEVDWREVYSFLMLNTTKSYNDSIINNLEKNLSKNEIVELSLNQGYYFYKVFKLKDRVPDQWLEQYTAMLGNKLVTTDLEQSHLLYIYYSELVRNQDMPTNNRLNEKIKKTIIESNSKRGNGLFYEKDGVTNTLSTLSYRIINDNLNLNLINWNTEDFLSELNKYKYRNGGYSLVIGEKPDLLNTLVGIMLEEAIEGTQSPIIF